MVRVVDVGQLGADHEGVAGLLRQVRVVVVVVLDVDAAVVRGRHQPLRLHLGPCLWDVPKKAMVLYIFLSDYRYT